MADLELFGLGGYIVLAAGPLSYVHCNPFRHHTCPCSRLLGFSYVHKTLAVTKLTFLSDTFVWCSCCSYAPLVTGTLWTDHNAIASSNSHPCDSLFTFFYFYFLRNILVSISFSIHTLLMGVHSCSPDGGVLEYQDITTI